MALLLQRVTRKNKQVQNTQQKTNIAAARMGTDLTSLDGNDRDKFILDFPDPDDLLHFSCTFHVSEKQSMWYGGVYKFDFVIPEDYPYNPPKVTLNSDHKIWHPNIDVNGAVCLNIIKNDWKCVCAINQVFFGLYFLFYEPNTDDPLNLEAADEMRNNRDQFAKTVIKTLKGGTHHGVTYPNMSVKLKEFQKNKRKLMSQLNGITDKAEASKAKSGEKMDVVEN